MKLLRVQALNFRSFENLDLDLNVDGLIAVVGTNGAGKSTIFAAIEWCLYGQRGRGALPARRDGCPDGQECWVEVHFEVGGAAYGVRRVDGMTARLFDLPTGEEICDGREATSRHVATLLGLTRDMFRGTFYARQGEVLALDSDDEGKRRRQVELLLGIERLRRATAHAQTAVKEQKHVVVTLEASAPDLEALKTEAARIAQEAQRDAPVKKAQERVEQAKHARNQAKGKLDALRVREREMMERRGQAQGAHTEAQQRRADCEALHAQVAEAEAAGEELARLTPVAGRIESLAVSEREMDLKRADHERAGKLREDQHRALTVAAGLADQLAALTTAERVQTEDSIDSDNNATVDPEAQIEAVEQELEALRPTLRELGITRQAAERRAQETSEQIARAEQCAELDAKLAELPTAEKAVEDALTKWHALAARHAQVGDAITHDTQHREAVLAGEKQASCPTCKRAYGDGELDEIVAGYDRDIQAAHDLVVELARQLASLKTAGAQARSKAEALRTLAADRRAIGEVPPPERLPALREAVAAESADVTRLKSQEKRDEAHLTELNEQLPRLRARAREAAERQRQIATLEAQRAQAESEARLYGEQLSSAGLNGYEPDAHVRVRTELAEAHAASQRCAALHGKVEGLELLRRRLEEQRSAAVEADARHAKLDAAVSEVAVDADALQAAEDVSTTAEREVDAAHTVLLEENRQATLDSQALATANARLQDARQQTAQLREQRQELRARTEVAEALGAFREDASRRTRPTLEHETGLLLGQTTRQRYNSVKLTASYQLEVIDGQKTHPLRRFSGGEQDLAGLCLRLALSRTLARQRGAETGFVLLDEVFGSQDPDRRRALLDQLHAIADSEFRQVFVISHTDDVVQHCDLAIDVERNDNGVSVALGPRR